MSVTVCHTPVAHFHVESAAIDNWSAPTKILTNNREEKQPDQCDIWTMIQSQKAPAPNAAAPYVHLLVRRSLCFMSKSSLEMCTESLGSETGSGDSSDDNGSCPNSSSNDEEQLVVQQQRDVSGKEDANQLMSVGYHCSVGRRSLMPRSFPPPLPSISRSEGHCIQMRTCRHDGRLVVDTVPVASPDYLRSRRHDGRLLLTFNNSAATSQFITDKQENPLLNQEEQVVEQIPTPSKEPYQSLEDAEDEEEDEDEEEVEVLDRGTMVEVKVSSQPQHPGGAKKVHRSSLVINKFVGGSPLTNQNRWLDPAHESHHRDSLPASHSPLSPQRRPTTTTSTTTAAAAAVAASSASPSSDMVGQPKPEKKLLFTSKRRNREEMLQHMRRCSELRRPLFFWEAGCIATSF